MVFLGLIVTVLSFFTSGVRCSFRFVSLHVYIYLVWSSVYLFSSTSFRKDFFSVYFVVTGSLFRACLCMRMLLLLLLQNVSAFFEGRVSSFSIFLGLPFHIRLLAGILSSYRPSSFFALALPLPSSHTTLIFLSSFFPTVTFLLFLIPASLFSPPCVLSLPTQ